MKKHIIPVPSYGELVENLLESLDKTFDEAFREKTSTLILRVNPEFKYELDKKGIKYGSQSKTGG